jgi:hypothetical protein
MTLRVVAQPCLTSPTPRLTIHGCYTLYHHDSGRFFDFPPARQLLNPLDGSARPELSQGIATASYICAGQLCGRVGVSVFYRVQESIICCCSDLPWSHSCLRDDYRRVKFRSGATSSAIDAPIRSVPGLSTAAKPMTATYSRCCDASARYSTAHSGRGTAAPGHIPARRGRR